MNILVTLDKNYLSPLKVMLTSLLLNNPNECFEIYIATDDLCIIDMFYPQRI